MQKRHLRLRDWLGRRAVRRRPWKFFKGGGIKPSLSIIDRGSVHTAPSASWDNCRTGTPPTWSRLSGVEGAGFPNRNQHCRTPMATLLGSTCTFYSKTNNTFENVIFAASVQLETFHNYRNCQSFVARRCRNNVFLTIMVVIGPFGAGIHPASKPTLI